MQRLYSVKISRKDRGRFHGFVIGRLAELARHKHLVYSENSNMNVTDIDRYEFIIPNLRYSAAKSFVEKSRRNHMKFACFLPSVEYIFEITRQ